MPTTTVLDMIHYFNVTVKGKHDILQRMLEAVFGVEVQLCFIHDDSSFRLTVDCAETITDGWNAYDWWELNTPRMQAARIVEWRDRLDPLALSDAAGAKPSTDATGITGFRLTLERDEQNSDIQILKITPTWV